MATKDSVQDISERNLTKEALSKANRAFKTLSACNRALIHIRDEVELLHEVCRVFVKVGGYRLAWVGYAEQDSSKTVTPMANSGYEKGYLKKANVTWMDSERGYGPVGSSIRKRKPYIVRYVQTDPKFKPWRSEAVKRGYGSVASLPLFLKREILGSLAIYAPEPDAFDKEELNLLKEIADNLSYGIEGLRERKAREKAERELQKSNDELELRVKQRTAALVALNGELKAEIEKRRLVEEALKQSSERLEQIVSQQFDAQEQVRRRFARELHDELGQSLLVLKLQVAAIERSLKNRQRPLKEKLIETIEQINSIIENVRRLSRDLSPLVLENLGLSSALRWLCDEFSQNSRSRFSVKIDNIDNFFNPHLQSLIYRIIQECLTNITKHAEASDLDISAKIRGNEVIFQVKDDGKGFDLRKACAATNSKEGLGLAIMNERVRILNGSLSISSQEGNGTTIAFSIPVK